MSRSVVPMLFVTILVASCGHASWDEPEQVTLLRYYNAGKFLYCFQVPIARAKRLPTWNGEMSTVPVSREAAQAIALKEVAASYPEGRTFGPTSTNLNRVAVRTTDPAMDVWYYIVEFAAVDGSDRRYAATEYVSVVLFDGKSVPKQSDQCLRPLREHS